jgi:hypothetical protein
VNAYRADFLERPAVIIQAQDFRLPEVLRHIEAGKIVLVVPAIQHPR